jgi:hypothetical protein
MPCIHDFDLFSSPSCARRFDAGPADRRDFLFTVRHYAGAVTYDTAGFLEKNKDQLYQEMVDLLRSSACPIVQVGIRSA